MANERIIYDGWELTPDGFKRYVRRITRPDGSQWFVEEIGHDPRGNTLVRFTPADEPGEPL